MALTAKKVYAILKRQISDMEAKIKTPIIYRGTVATADLLPLNPDIGDMYNIESKSVYGEAGMNVAWNGVVWDTMGAPIDMSLYIKSNELADWVKQQNKPTYTAEEVGALPVDTKIPSKTSDLQNDSGFLTKIPDNYLSGTDKTLSVSGKAADAKATGDKITELSADISNKLNKNQGSENSGKIAGINESGDIVPMFPVSVDYNEETNCLEFGSDQKMELNKGINLDSTLTKTGYAADAGAVGEITNSLKEDLENLEYGYTPYKTIMPYNSLMGFTEDDIIPNSYIGEYSGVLKPFDGWFASKWVAYTTGEIVRLYETYEFGKATPMADVYYAFYDADYKFISGGFTSVNNLDIMSDDVKACRLRISHSNVKTQLLLVAGNYTSFQSERASRYIKDWKSPNIDFVLPPVIFHFDEYINIYYDNLFVGSEKPTNSCIGFSDYIGNFQKNSLIIRPSDNNSRAVDMMCSFDGVNDVWYKKQTNTIIHRLIVNYVNTGYEGKTINVMFLGDSITANGTYPKLVKEYFAKDSSLIVNLIGTLQDGNAEGRGGWGADTYTSQENYNDCNNAFWFNNKFDFSSYMATNFPNTDVNLVFINLGINDMLRTDDIESVIKNYKIITNSIKAYNQNVVIAIGLPILPANFEYADSTVNGVRQFEKRKRLELIKALIAEYGNTVYYASFYMAVDCKTDFPTERKAIDGFTEKDVCTDITHPNHTGYAKIASVCQPIIRQVASTLN